MQASSSAKCYLHHGIGEASRQQAGRSDRVVPRCIEHEEFCGFQHVSVQIFKFDDCSNGISALFNLFILNLWIFKNLEKLLDCHIYGCVTTIISYTYVRHAWNQIWNSWMIGRCLAPPDKRALGNFRENVAYAIVIYFRSIQLISITRHLSIVVFDY